MRRRRSILWISLIMTLLISMATVNVPLSTGNPGTVLSAPLVRDSSLDPGSTLIVNITVAEVSQMLGYMFTLRYDPNVLTAVSAAPWPPPPYPIYFPPFYQPLPSKINNTAGYVQLAAITYYADPEGINTTEPMAICRIDFVVDDYGESVLDLHDTKLTDIHGDEMDHTVVDGHFSNLDERHDVAVAGVTANQSIVTSGRSISINVTVTNEGNVLETFDVAIYYQGSDIFIGTQSVTDLVPKTYRTVGFLWDTTGVAPGPYVITANASVVEDETDTADNTYVYIPESDLSVTNVTASPSIVVVNDTVSIDVTIRNEGNVSETFNASAYYGETLVETKTGVYLLAGETITLPFAWDTTGVGFGTYTIKAEASPVPGETDTADNVKEDGQVTVASGLHDIYIYGVIAKSWQVVVGANATIYVTVGNQGTFTENVTVTVHLNEIALEQKNVTDLAPDTMTTLSFTWDTTGVALGTYKIIANASGVPDDINKTNNVYVVDGKLTVVAEVHDIAVTSVTAPSAVVLGDPVTIDVDLKNEGNVPESFTLNVLYNGDSIESRSVSLEAGATETESFTWDTTGVALGTYTITAEVPAVPGETETDDNVETTSVTVAVRDIAIVSVTPSKTQVTIGESITIHVTVKNEGNAFPESFSLTAKYDNIVIGTQSYTNLPKGASKTFSFTWDTTGINVGTYTLSANASVVLGEKPEDQADNIYTGGTVTLKWWRSTISMSVSSTTVTIGGSITINGSINPTRVGVAVTIWQRLSGTETWNNITVVQTNENSQYTFEWKPTTAGDYEVKASWEGDAETFGDESDPQTIAVQEAPPSISLYAVAGIAVVIVMAIVLVYVLRVRKPKPT